MYWWGGCECQSGGRSSKLRGAFFVSYGFHKLTDCLFLMHPHMEMLMLHTITVKIKAQQIFLWLEL